MTNFVDEINNFFNEHFGNRGKWRFEKDKRQNLEIYLAYLNDEYQGLRLSKEFLHDLIQKHTKVK